MYWVGRSVGACLRSGLLVTAALLGTTAALADVYVSDAEAGPRFASQRLDDSYRLLLREPQASPHGISADPALDAMVSRIAARHSVPAELVQAVVAVESGGNARAVSPRGARGLMQLMPGTANALGVTASRLHDPEANIDAGVRHLKALITKHGGNIALALAAYNAGDGAISKHHGRIPPYRETMLYVPAVLAKAAADGRR